MSTAGGNPLQEQRDFLTEGTTPPAPRPTHPLLGAAGLTMERLRPKDTNSLLNRSFLESLVQHHPEEDKGNKALKTLEWVVDKLSRGQYASANAALALRRGDWDVWHPIVRGFLGQEKGSYSDVVHQMGLPETPGKIGADDVLGLMGDIFLDPTTYLGIGNLTRLGEAAKSAKYYGRGAEVLGDLQKAMPEHLAEQIRQFVREGKNTTYGKTLAEQFKTGQRTMFSLERPTFRRLGKEGLARHIPVPEFVLPTLSHVPLVGRIPGAKFIPILPPFPKMAPYLSLSVPKISPAIEGGLVQGLAAAGHYLRESAPGISPLVQATGKMFNTYFRPAGADPQVWDELSDEIGQFKTRILTGKGQTLDEVKAFAQKGNGVLHHVLEFIGVGGPLHSNADLKLLMKAIESPEKLKTVESSRVNEILFRAMQTYDPVAAAAKATTHPEGFANALDRLKRRVEIFSEAVSLQRSGRVPVTDLPQLESDLKEAEDALASLQGGGGPPSGGSPSAGPPSPTAPTSHPAPSGPIGQPPAGTNPTPAPGGSPQPGVPPSGSPPPGAGPVSRGTYPQGPPGPKAQAVDEFVQGLEPVPGQKKLPSGADELTKLQHEQHLMAAEDYGQRLQSLEGLRQDVKTPKDLEALGGRISQYREERDRALKAADQVAADAEARVGSEKAAGEAEKRQAEAQKAAEAEAKDRESKAATALEKDPMANRPATEVFPFMQKSIERTKEAIATAEAQGRVEAAARLRQNLAELEGRTVKDLARRDAAGGSKTYAQSLSDRVREAYLHESAAHAQAQEAERAANPPSPEEVAKQETEKNRDSVEKYAQAQLDEAKRIDPMLKADVTHVDTTEKGANVVVDSDLPQETLQALMGDAQVDVHKLRPGQTPEELLHALNDKAAEPVTSASGEPGKPEKAPVEVGSAAPHEEAFMAREKLGRADEIVKNVGGVGSYLPPSARKELESLRGEIDEHIQKLEQHGAGHPVYEEEAKGLKRQYANTFPDSGNPTLDRSPFEASKAAGNEVAPKRKTPETPTKAPVNAAGEFVIPPEHQPELASLRSITRENAFDVITAHEAHVSGVTFFDRAGSPRESTLEKFKRVFTENSGRVGDSGLPEIRGDELAYGPAIHEAKYYPEYKTAELYLASGESVQVRFKTDLPEAVKLKTEGKFDGHDSFEEAVAAWKEKHPQYDKLQNAGAQAEYRRLHPIEHLTTKGTTKKITLKKGDLTAAPIYEGLIGKNRPPSYPVGTVVYMEGKVGIVRSYGAVGGAKEGEAASKIRMVEFDDGTTTGFHVDDLMIESAKEAARRGQSLVQWIKRVMQDETGAVNLDALFPFMDKFFKNKELRQAFAAEAADDVIRLSKGLEHRRMAIRDWFDAMSAEEKSRGMLSGYIAFYFPHLGEVDKPWSWLLGRGRLRVRREYHMYVRNLEGTIDELNAAADAAGLGKLFNEDTLLGLAVRGTASDRAVKTYDFIQHMLDRFAMPVDSINPTGFESTVALMSKMPGVTPERIARAKVVHAELAKLTGHTTTQAIDVGKQILAGKVPKEVGQKAKLLRAELDSLLPEVGLYLHRGAFRNFPKASDIKQLMDEGKLTPEEMAAATSLLNRLGIQGKGEHVIAIPMDRLKDLLALQRYVKGHVLPKEVADAMNGTLNNFAQVGPDVQPFLAAFDGLQNLWKAWTLSIYPVYHTRNMIGNLWNSWLAGLRDTKHYSNAFKFQNGEMKYFSDGNGRHWTAEEIEKTLTDLGVVNKGFYAAELVRSIEQDILPAYPRSMGELKDIRQVLSLVAGDRNMLLRMGKKWGTAVENNARIALFFHALSEGKSELEAALTVKKYLFDYSELTQFERGFFKRLFPFYSWTRFNLPLQFEHLITRPGPFSAVAKARNMISAQSPEAPDESLLPKWMKDEAPVKVAKNPDGTYSYFLLGGWLPAADMLKVVDPLALAGGMVTPIVKAPIEFGLNWSLFFEDNIERLPEETGTFLGARMNKKKINLLRNIRLLNTLDRTLYDKNFPAAQKVSNLFFGRTYPVNFRDEKEMKLYQTERQLKDLHKSLSREKAKVRDDLRKGIPAQAGVGAVKTLKDAIDVLALERRKLKTTHVEGPKRPRLGAYRKPLSPEREQEVREMARRRGQ